MLLQPYIENAIWHGLMHKDTKGKIEINLQLDDEEEMLFVTILDDGIGRKKALELKSKMINRKKRKSMGMHITQDKIDVINFLHDLDASVEIEDLYHPTGAAAGTRREAPPPEETLPAGTPPAAFVVDGQLRVTVHLGEGESQGVVFQFDHLGTSLFSCLCCSWSSIWGTYQLPSRTSRPSFSTTRSGASRRERMSSAKSRGR